jgi:hypothetical protein
LVQGTYSIVPDISAEEREFLIWTARSLTEWVDPKKVVKYGNNRRWANRVKRSGEERYQSQDVPALLKRNGWTPVGKARPNYQLYRGPEETKGYSASLIKGRTLLCLSRNAKPFEPDKTYDASAVFTLLELQPLF